MSKTRVFGQQIQVKLHTADKSKPLVFDFDSIMVEKLIDVKQYKTIGKSIMTYQPVSNGYRITLSRQKRDGHLQELIKVMDALSQNKQRYYEMVLENITVYSVSADSFNPEEEFNQNNNFISDLIRLAQERIVGAITTGISNVAEPFQNAFNFALGQINANRPLYIDTEEYKDCTITEFSSNAEGSQNEVVEKITLYSSGRIFQTTEKLYKPYAVSSIALSSVREEESNTNGITSNPDEFNLINTINRINN